jgi:hypothetical protein
MGGGKAPAVGQDHGDRLRQRPQGPDDHAVRAGVRAEHRVRVVAGASHDGVDLGPQGIVGR